MAYQDYVKDYGARTYYDMSYTEYIENIVDTLIGQANCVKLSPSDIVKIDYFPYSDLVVTSPGVTIQMEQIASDAHPQEDIRARVDNNCTDKVRSFLNHSEANFTFIGPDREPVLISDINQCVTIAKLIQETGKPNYALARIPLKSDLNIDAWQNYLGDYHDQYLIQYLKFGFPLSLSDPDSLNRTHIDKHASSLQYPRAIEQYLDKECRAGAMIGPFRESPDPGFHCSPMLTRPKDTNKRSYHESLSSSRSISQ